MDDLFLPNKYTKWYFSLIQKAKERTLPKGVYKEMHHIIPKSCNGPDTKENIVGLTAKEHYIVHLLLCKMCVNRKHEIKMLFALHLMQHVTNINRPDYSSRMYKIFKEEISEAFRERYTGEGNPFYGKTHSPEAMAKIMANRTPVCGENHYLYGRRMPEETKEKIRQTKAANPPLRKYGKDNPHYGRKLSPEHIEKVRLAMIGRTFSEESKKKLSESKKGAKNPNFGKVYTEEERKQMSEKSKGIPLSSELTKSNRKKKVEKCCKIVFEYFNEITDENIKEAKAKGWLGKTFPGVRLIVEVLGYIPTKDYFSSNEHST